MNLRYLSKCCQSDLSKACDRRSVGRYSLSFFRQDLMDCLLTNTMRRTTSIALFGSNAAIAMKTRSFFFSSSRCAIAETLIAGELTGSVNLRGVTPNESQSVQLVRVKKVLEQKKKGVWGHRPKVPVHVECSVGSRSSVSSLIR
jgi:hypothetical protein